MGIFGTRINFLVSVICIYRPVGIQYYSIYFFFFFLLSRIFSKQMEFLWKVYYFGVCVCWCNVYTQQPKAVERARISALPVWLSDSLTPLFSSSSFSEKKKWNKFSFSTSYRVFTHTFIYSIYTIHIKFKKCMCLCELYTFTILLLQHSRIDICAFLEHNPENSLQKQTFQQNKIFNRVLKFIVE